MISATRSDVKLKLEVDGFNWDQCANVYRRAAVVLGNNALCAGGAGMSCSFYDFSSKGVVCKLVYLIFLFCILIFSWQRVRIAAVAIQVN